MIYDEQTMKSRSIPLQKIIYEGKIYKDHAHNKKLQAILKINNTLYLSFLLCPYLVVYELDTGKFKAIPTREKI